MRLFAKCLAGLLFYVVWPSAAAVWAFERTGQIFREKLIALPFEIFGTAVAAGVYCFALSAALVLVGLWKPRKGKRDANQKSRSTGLPSDRRPVVDAGMGG